MALCEDWISADDLIECGEVDSEVPPVFDLSVAAHFASVVLYNLSGQQFRGVCGPETVRPYALNNCGCSYGVGDLITYGTANTLTGRCDGHCAYYRLKLEGPIVSVDEVLHDGEALVEGTNYRISGTRYLERIDRTPWPCSQDLTLATTEERTLSVTYSYGVAIPSDAAYCAKLFAQDLVNKSCLDCLPDHLTAVNREGFSMAIDAADWPSNKTGIEEVDAWLWSVNPQGRRRRARIFRADDRRRLAR